MTRNLYKKYFKERRDSLARLKQHYVRLEENRYKKFENFYSKFSAAQYATQLPLGFRYD